MKVDKTLLKEEVLNEVSYRRFMQEVTKVSGSTKKKRGLVQMKKMLKEMEDMYSHITRLDEADGADDGYWEKNRGHLAEISNKMIDMGLKIRKIGKK